MKAVTIHQYGDPDVLTYEDVARPEAKDDELLIRVRAAGVNPIDCKTRAGGGIAGQLQDPFPLILGWDVSGVVETVGRGLTDFKVGDEVYGMVRFPEIGAAYAEYVAAPAADVALKPASLSHPEAAALPLVFLTAWQAIFDAGDLQQGQTILIHAAAGGVGHIAVQLAKWKGAFVIGTASGRNAAFLDELGVDAFVNYQTTNLAAVGQKVDVVLDSVSGQGRQQSWQTLNEDGVLVSILGAPSAETAAQYGVRADNILVRPDQAQLNELSQLVEAGLIKPTLDAVYPLRKAAKAHEHVEQGHTRGKVVLDV